MNPRLQEAARLYTARDYPGAEAACRGVLGEAPGDFDALHLLGVVLTLQDRPAEAVPFLRDAAAIGAGNGLVVVNLGNALLALEQYEALLALPVAGNADGLNNLGLAYRGLGRHDAAAGAFRQAVAARWDHAGGWFNLAGSLLKLGRLEDALHASTRALRVAPLDTPVQRLADSVNETGRILLALGRPLDALARWRDFLNNYPGQISVVWNMSLCLLLLGRFEEGWRAYECRFEVPGHDGRPAGAAVLDPAQIAGKRVLILTEQGRGDMLQFIRYAPLLAARGATVLVEAYPDLMALVAAMPCVSMVTGTGDPRPEADLATPAMSLPLAFGYHPANIPYLGVPAGRTVRLEPSIRPRVGVAWSGSVHSRERSALPAEALAPLLALPGFTFHCLQTEIAEPDRAWLRSVQLDIALHEGELRDFADTAALIAAMDIVVSIDTAVAHLAGAMGKPLLLMLAFNPDWRWMLGRSDSPWYPTARLYRQPAPGAWGPVVEAVIADLPKG